jgi:hypothetical protein
MIYRGQCHCGAIRYTYQTEIRPEDWSIRADQCSFCRAHGSRMTSDPAGFAQFISAGPAHLRRYRFGQRTADFLLCAECGVYVGAAIETAAGCFAVVSVNALVPYLDGLKPAQPVDFDGESVAERTRRREERWTPCKL